jgi:hypothetical protein
MSVKNGAGIPVPGANRPAVAPQNSTTAAARQINALAELASPEVRSLYNLLESLRPLKLATTIRYPQIVMVGDRSSGKSSVLEAITQVQFTVGDNSRTKFVTEFVLCRNDTTDIKVSIQRGSSSTSSNVLDAGPFRRAEICKDAILEIYKEAEERMGLTNTASNGFSSDILRIEIGGPQLCPMTLVDHPGIMPAGPYDQSQESKVVVDQVITTYLKQDTSIILAVIAGNKPSRLRL